MVAKDQIKILVVDDEVELCDTIVSLFSSSGFTAVGVYSATDALTLLDQQDFSIVISDIRMPKHDGFFLLKEIKKRNSIFPKVLFISGHHIDVESCYSQGIEGFFQKPFNFNEIKRAITRCLLRKKDWLRHPLNGSRGLVSKKYYDWDELLASKFVGFGKNGLFISENYQFYKPGHLINFKFRFVSGHPLPKVEGQGIIKWIRRPSENKLPPGIGLEVVHVKKECIDFYLEYIEQLDTIATIPICG